MKSPSMRRYVSSEQRTQMVLYVIEVGEMPIEGGHLRASTQVRKCQTIGHRRDAICFLQVHRLDCFEIWPAVEVPGLLAPSRRFDFEKGPAKRELRAVVGQERVAIVP